MSGPPQPSFEGRPAGRPSSFCGEACGRVNLIGEHTDYNDGLVLPIALPLRTRVTVTWREGAAPASPYVRAVGRVLGAEGFDVAIESDVPPGAGLASSAALTVAAARALDPGLDDRAAAEVAHRAESDEMGIGVGVMDHMAAALGRDGEALLIDCRSLEAERVPLPPEVELLVIDSGVRHANAAAVGYRTRVEECRRACSLLGVETLRDLASVAGSGAAIMALPEPLDRRVGHVLAESERVRGMAAALAASDLPAMAALLREGHASLRDLYEVSVPEVDAVVAAAERSGAIGARLTGGGFGGSVVALCRIGEALEVGLSAVQHSGGTAQVVLPRPLGG